MTWPFDGKHDPEAPHDEAGKHQSNPLAPPALTAQDQKLYELEMRILGLEDGITELCYHLKAHIDRIDHNTKMLDKNLHNLAAAVLRPPKDLLGGGQESN